MRVAGSAKPEDLDRAGPPRPGVHDANGDGLLGSAVNATGHLHGTPGDDPSIKAPEPSSTDTTKRQREPYQRPRAHGSDVEFCRWVRIGVGGVEVNQQVCRTSCWAASLALPLWVLPCTPRSRSSCSRRPRSSRSSPQPDRRTATLVPLSADRRAGVCEITTIRRGPFTWLGAILPCAFGRPALR
jgi:hypothetical protein